MTVDTASQAFMGLGLVLLLVWVLWKFIKH